MWKYTKADPTNNSFTRGEVEDKVLNLEIGTKYSFTIHITIHIATALLVVGTLQSTLTITEEIVALKEIGFLRKVDNQGTMR